MLEHTFVALMLGRCAVGQGGGHHILQKWDPLGTGKRTGETEEDRHRAGTDPSMLASTFWIQSKSKRAQNGIVADVPRPRIP